MAVTAVNTPSRISSRPMRLVPRLPATAALCLVAGLAQAAVVQRVDVVGVDEAMAENVYRAWVAKFITGEAGMDQWDAYVAEWNAAGGQRLTDYARTVLK